MFDMGFAELLLIAVIGLLVIGPKRMPEAIRVLGYWLGKLRRSVNSARQEMEREFGLDDMRKDLHNQSLLAQFEKERRQIEHSLSSSKPATDSTLTSENNANSGENSALDNESDTADEEREMLQAFEDFEKEFGVDDVETENSDSAQGGTDSKAISNTTDTEATKETAEEATSNKPDQLR